jgi:mRNA-degrading endonuclease RelE of RelBE toxin-antitoxin system
MIEATDSYKVIVPSELINRWDALSNRDHRQLSGRLERAAQSAHSHPVEWPDGEPGIHRGRHRALVGEMWLLYQVDDARRTLSLLGFGRSAR